MNLKADMCVPPDVWSSSRSAVGATDFRDPFVWSTTMYEPLTETVSARAPLETWLCFGR